MSKPLRFVSSTLAILTVLAFPATCAAQPHAHKHHAHHVAGRDDATQTVATAPTTILPTSLAPVTPCSTTSGCVSPIKPTSCPDINGWPFTEVPEMDMWTITCDIDYPEQNIYPFYLAGSYYDCLLECENHNKNNAQPPCAGFVFAPERVSDGDDCYLKYSLNNPASATIHLVGATLATSSIANAPTAIPSPPQGAQLSPGLQSTKLITPKVSNTRVLGASNNDPTKQYVKHQMDLPIKLESEQLQPGINLDLTNKYPLASDTGSWDSETASLATLANLTSTPHLSRDGGKGGEINGTHIFIFCDTAVFDDENMNAFVSSSVATDSGMNALSGKNLTLVDQIGEWQDDVGRMRGFAQMTTAEEAFNIALSGMGYRYAVWPESSLIPLNQSHSIMYASLVYDEVNMSTQEAKFTTLGNTLLLVSVDDNYGPTAQRVVKQLFRQNEVTWGSLGGFRSWGSSGVGGMDGEVYVFGQVNDGVLIARTSPSGVSDRSSYLYWNGSSWSSGMLPTNATSYLLHTPVMDLDVVYSPYHKTFVMVYLTPNADNTFYYRYLKPESPILPPHAGGTEDYAEAMVRDEWSGEQKLYTAHDPATGYIYAGALHSGYFGVDDITNGGTKMLLSWTEHTGQDASSPASGYAHMTVVVDLE